MPHRPPRRYHCDHCGRPNVNKRHRDRCGLPREVCHLCGKTFAPIEGPLNRRIHWRQEHSDHPVVMVCPFCGETFRGVSPGRSYTRHIDALHGNGGEIVPVAAEEGTGPVATPRMGWEQGDIASAEPEDSHAVAAGREFALGACDAQSLMMEAEDLESAEGENIEEGENERAHSELDEYYAATDDDDEVPRRGFAVDAVVFDAGDDEQGESAEGENNDEGGNELALSELEESYAASDDDEEVPRRGYAQDAVVFDTEADSDDDSMTSILVFDFAITQLGYDDVVPPRPSEAEANHDDDLFAEYGTA